MGDLTSLDLQGSIWAYWWSAFSLENGLNPFAGSHNFYPIGQHPVSQYNILDGLLSAPLITLFGLRVGFNLACVAILASAGWAMQRFCRSLGLGFFAATAAGIALMCSSYLSNEISSGRPTQALVVFFLLGLTEVRHIANGSATRKNVIVLGLCTAACGLVYWYYLPLFAIAALSIWLTMRADLTRLAWKQILSSAAFSIALLLPFLVALAQKYKHLPGVERTSPEDNELTHLTGGDFGLQMAIETSEWPIWPLLKTPNTQSQALSWGVILLALWGLKASAKKEKRLLLTLFFIGWLFSLGPYLRLNDTIPTSIPLPFLWIHDAVPFMDRFWWPQRWEILCAIGIAGLAGLGVEQLHTSGRLKGVVQKGGLLLLLVACGFWARGGFLITSEIQRTPKALYQDVDGPILSFPIRGDSLSGAMVLLSQTVHEHPISGGLGQHLDGHRPPAVDKWMTENPFIEFLLEMEQGSSGTRQVQPEHIQGLLEQGLRYVAIDPHNFPSKLGPRRAASYFEVCSELFGEPLRIEAGGAIWKITAINEAKEIEFRLSQRAHRRLRDAQ